MDMDTEVGQETEATAEAPVAEKKHRKTAKPEGIGMYQKWLKVMADCAKIPQNGYNEFHRYHYVRTNDVIAQVNKSCVQYGIATIVSPRVVSERPITTDKGKTDTIITVEVVISLIDTETGEKMELVGIGSSDGGATAVMRASLSAQKYAYMLSLHISHDDEGEEGEKQTPPSRQPSSQQPTQPSQPINRPNQSFSQNAVCTCCAVPISEAVESYSVRNFGKALCRECQKKADKVA